MSDVFSHTVTRDAPWVDPVAVAKGLGGGDGALALLSDGGPGGRWSHVAQAPDVARVGPVDDAAPFEALRDPLLAAGAVGLAAYDAGARPANGSARDGFGPI